MSRAIIIVSSIIVLLACHQQKNVSSPKTGIELKDTLTISFLSRGEGPDRKAVPEFRAYQDSTTKRLGKSIFLPSRSWGREGEHDIQVVFKGVSHDEQERITKEIEDFDTKYDLVLIKVFVKKP